MGSLFAKLRQVVDATARRYALFGLIVTAASYLFLFTLVLVFDVPNVPANFATLIFGLAMSYLFNRNFVFRHTGRQWAAALRFSVVVAVAYGVNLLVLQVLLTYAPIPDAFAQFLAFSVYTVIAYVGHRVWTFSHGHDDAERAPNA